MIACQTEIKAIKNVINCTRRQCIAFACPPSDVVVEGERRLSLMLLKKKVNSSFILFIIKSFYS